MVTGSMSLAWVPQKIRSRPLSFAFYFIWSGATLYGLWRAWAMGQGYSDFNVYHRAGQQFFLYLTGGAFDPGFFDLIDQTYSPYRYSPLWAWFFIPFSWLPLEIARPLWVLGQYLFYLLALRLVGRYFQLSDGQRFWVLVGTIRFAVDNANIAQVSALLTWLLVVSALASLPWQRALGFMLAVGLKLQPVILGLVWSKRISEFKWPVIALVGTVLGSLSFGWQAFEVWIARTKSAADILNPAVAGNQSLYGFWVRDFGRDHGATGFMITLILFGAISLYQWKKSSWSSLFAWTLGLAYLPVFGILTWKNTYLLWILPLAYSIRYRPRLTIGLCVYFVSTSQGIIGGAANGWLINHGVLGWVSAIMALILLDPMADRTPEKL